MNKRRVFTIPNLLSLLRLLMVPLFVWTYTVRQDGLLTALVLALSGLTDILDGQIARRYSMVSDVGKILDPIADKVTQGAMMICLITRFHAMWVPLILLIVKEAFVGITNLIGERYVYFLSGGSLGMDMFAAETILELQKDYPWISLEIVTPFDAQAARWAPEYRERHDRLLEQADTVTPICHEYTKSCMFRRNRYLVDEADLLLAAFDGKPGGTAMTIDYANRNRVPVKYIIPHA